MQKKRTFDWTSHLPYLLVLLTIAALGIGAWFYWQQLAITPPLLWLFVPDCPLYGALVSFVLLFGLFSKNDTVRFVIAAASAHFGLWTIFVLLSNGGYYFADASASLQGAVMLAGHSWMVFSAFLILPRKADARMLMLAVLWLGFNTLVDYRINPYSTHPWIPISALGITEYYSWMSSIIWPALLAMAAGAVSKMGQMQGFAKALRLRIGI